ncbi:MAG: pyridoxal 5'-phosphate synthase lyase subunit PdxS [Deinococcus sp.]
MTDQAADPTLQTATPEIKTGFAEMFKGGVIMDVVTPDQARVAEAAGATAVMALERVPADIRRDGGVARMSDPQMIRAIIGAVSIPVMAKVRIGHFVEAQILQALGVDFIDESEVLTPADESYHIEKRGFKVPFVNGSKNLGEALRRVGEGASMIRTKGEAGTGNVVEAVRHARTILGEIRSVQARPLEELMTVARDLQAPYELVRWVHEHGTLPVVNFAAGGIVTPADAALMMQLGLDGVFVGSGIFKSGEGDLAKIEKRARAIVKAVTHFGDPDILAEVSTDLGEPMVGINLDTLELQERLATRGW